MIYMPSFVLGLICGMFAFRFYQVWVKQQDYICGYCKGLGWRTQSKTTDHGHGMYTTEQHQVTCKDCKGKGSTSHSPLVERIYHLLGKMY